MMTASVHPNANPPARQVRAGFLAPVVLCSVFAMACLSSAHAQTATESTLYSFTGKTDSQHPAASLIQGGDGNLYGTATGNFYPDYGAVYELALPADTFTTLHKFTGATDSATPFSSLLYGSSGHLYGTTYGNLIFGTDGTVYEIPPSTGILTTLFQFTGGANGSNPISNLIQDSDGNFYGATSGAGTGDGTLFELSPTNSITTLVSFTKYNGASVNSSPIIGSDGNFYGVTYGGGTTGFGTVYSLSAGALTTLYTFQGAGDGAEPAGPLVEGPDGNFYGATSDDGSVTSANGGYGTIFKITPSGVLTTLHVFNGTTDGGGPYPLFLASDGNFYGVAYLGGTNSEGTIFEITPGGTFTVLYNFGATGDGTEPQAGLIQASDGNFYGAAYGGGANALGTVFKFTPATALAAPVQLNASAASIPLGSPLTLSWSVLNAFSDTMQLCYASVSSSGSTIGAGAWSGQQEGTYNSTTQLFSGSATFTPTLSGTYTYGLTCGGVESGTVEVTVGNPLALQILTTSVPVASVGLSYSATVSASGGVKPYSFSLTSGSLPAGLTLNSSTGVISGTPTQTGIAVFAIQVTDSDSVQAATATASLEIIVVQPLVVTTASTLPADRIGTVYTETLTATGGTPPYTWSALSSLPAGLLLSSAGVLSGTPTAAGTTTFTVQISDSSTIASQTVNGTFSITVEPLIVSTGTVILTPPSISVGQATSARVYIEAPTGSPAPTGTVQFQSNGVDLGASAMVANGTASVTTPAFTATGDFAITANYSGDPNYLPLDYAPATLAVSVAPVPAIGITPSSVTLTAGQTAYLTASVLNFSSQSITFACGNLPANVSCSFGALSSAGTATLAIQATTTAALHNEPRVGGGRLNATMLAFAFPTLLAFGGLFRKRNSAARLLWMLPMFVLLLLGLAITACGGSSQQNAIPGTDIITVTATANNQTASTEVAVTIK